MSDDDWRSVPKTEALVPDTRAKPGNAPTPPSVQSTLQRLRRAKEAPYVDRGHVASGGMGSIDRVQDTRLGRESAMKRIHLDAAQDPKAVALFVREAQITGQLEHPNIVPVYELDERDGRVRFTMKLVDGRTLQALVDQFPAGPLSRGTLFDLLEIVLKVCDALAYAHSRGVLHLDVKPANVMVGEFGQIYLMDWGVARLIGEEAMGGDPGGRPRVHDPLDSGFSSDGMVVGTPSFMPPEQARGDRLDPRTDVWAAGALVYYVLTRAAPYAGATQLQNLMAAREGSYAPILSLVEPQHVPSALRAIVERAMDPEPSNRFASIPSLRGELVRFMRGDGSFPVEQYPAGTHVVVEGSAGDAAFFIRSGRCEAHRVRDGQRESLRVMGPGEVFGETAILSPGPRTATISALDDVTLLRIDADALRREVEGAQPWLAAIVGTLAQRFREKG